jgi:hypothetical protein
MRFFRKKNNVMITIFCDLRHFSAKTNVCDPNFAQKTSSIFHKNAFFRKMFWREYFKNHSIGPWQEREKKEILRNVVATGSPEGDFPYNFCPPFTAIVSPTPRPQTTPHPTPTPKKEDLREILIFRNGITEIQDGIGLPRVVLPSGGIRIYINRSEKY